MYIYMFKTKILTNQYSLLYVMDYYFLIFSSYFFNAGQECLYIDIMRKAASFLLS